MEVRMNNRERALAVLNYQSYDQMPIVHFGFWTETLEKWAREGYISMKQAEDWKDGNQVDRDISRILGFDFNWSSTFGCAVDLKPRFRKRIIETLPDGSRKVLDKNGAIILEKDDVVSIPKEIDHLFKGREDWQKLYKWRLKWRQDRLTRSSVRILSGDVTYDEGGREALLNRDMAQPLGVSCGSLFGYIRNWLGVVGLSYLMADDPDLVDEIIDTLGELALQGVKAALGTGAIFDFGHFWEDICFKTGPLISPRFFAAKVGPHYRRITDLLNQNGIHIVSLDCDGKIDELVPVWFENGVNTMFPIEVGTWNASIKPWRQKYGKELRGVGGMNKVVFAHDRSAIDKEVQRIRDLVDLGGFIPCPDHRIPPDAKWENVQYYTERMRQAFA
jgi:hypothetical protein